MPVTSRLFEVQDAIKEKHGGSVGKVKLCLDEWRENESLPDMTKMLKEVNIVQEARKIFYEFDSFSHPLLTTTIKCDHEKVFKPPSQEELTAMFTVKQKNGTMYTSSLQRETTGNTTSK